MSGSSSESAVRPSDRANGKAEAGTSASSFIRESIAELKKVHSPTRAETIQATLVTLVIMIVVSLALFLMDFTFKSLMHVLIAPS